MSAPADRLLAALRHRDAAHVEDALPAGFRTATLAAIVAGEPLAAPTRRRVRAGAFGRWPRLHVRVVLPACAALLACVLAGVLVITQRPATVAPALRAAPVSFRYPRRGPDSGDIVATVTDPFAAQSALDAAFRAAGLDITVTLVPASPSAVGTVVEISEPSGGPQIETLTGGTCVTGGGGPGNCPVGLKIPRRFTGAGAITLGRPARPNEDYESTNSAFAPGESLHCSGLIGTTVAAASAALAARDITVQWQQAPGAALPLPATQPVTTPTATATTGAGAGTTATTATSTTASQSSSSGATAGATPPAGYHVLDGTPIRAGVVMLMAQRAPLSAATLALASRMYDAGCPARTG